MGSGIPYPNCPLLLVGAPTELGRRLTNALAYAGVAVHSLALVFVEESGVIGVVSALLAFSLVV